MHVRCRFPEAAWPRAEPGSAASRSWVGDYALRALFSKWGWPQHPWPGWLGEGHLKLSAQNSVHRKLAVTVFPAL